MLTRFTDTPWKMTNELQRWMLLPFAWLNFGLNGIVWGKGWKIFGLPIIQKHRQSVIRIGRGLGLRSNVRSNPLGPNHPVILCTWQAQAILIIGDHFGMTGGTLCAAQSITIGNNVAIGANSTIADTDFHPLDPTERRSNPLEAATAPIIIGDDVFIGMNCLVLKGVTIGKGSVIGAGSVVTRSIPPGVIAAGNPARVIRKLGI